MTDLRKMAEMVTADSFFHGETKALARAFLAQSKALDVAVGALKKIHYAPINVRYRSMAYEALAEIRKLMEGRE